VLFTKYLRDGVRSGAITRSVRVWISPRVRAGRRYNFEDGEIEIESIAPITVEQITPRLARECGFATVSDLLGVARHGRGENVYLIEFRYIAPKRGREQKTQPALSDGQNCVVVGGTHAGKSGIVRDIHTSKTGHVTITVERAGGARFKTLAKNVVAR
jgi:hypothetical protein